MWLYVPSRAQMVTCPAIAEQRDPYAKGDIKHTNIYKEGY